MAGANHCLPDESIHRTTPERSVVAAAAAAAAAGICRSTIAGTGLEVKQVVCECCALSEECTPGYIARVKELFCGHWVCGLCTEAVKEERHRMGRGASLEDAVISHMALCIQFNKLGCPNPAVNLADALKQLLSRNLEGHPAGNSPRASRSLRRTSSCIPALSSRPLS